MTERRPHWDIDLVDGVGRRLIPLYRSIGYCTDAERHRIYTLIEFMEDWMDANDNPLPHVLNECLQWLDAERAAIQRVREAVSHGFDITDADASDFDYGYARALVDVLSALVGVDGGDA